MKKFLIVVIGLSLPLFMKAQESEKRKEAGLVFSNLDNFGLTFKTGTNKSLWRFSTLLISGYNSEEIGDSSAYKRNGAGFSIGVGKEYRKYIAEKLALRFGADLSFSYVYDKTKHDDKTVDDDRDYMDRTKRFIPGINLVFGLNYEINDHLIIGAELLPYFKYSIGEMVSERYYINDGKEEKTDLSNFSYGLSNTSVLLSLVYKF